MAKATRRKAARARKQNAAERGRAQARRERDRAAREAAALRTARAREFEHARRKQLARAAIELDEVDVEIFRLVQTHPAITQTAIGDLVGLSRQQVQRRMAAPKVQRAFELAKRTVLEIFTAAGPAAARKLAELAQSKDERIALRAAELVNYRQIHASDRRDEQAEDFVSFLTEAWDRAKAADSQTPAPADPAKADAS